MLDLNLSHPKESDIPFELITFKGGEPHIKLDVTAMDNAQDLNIVTRIKSFNDLGVLAVAHNAVMESGLYDNLHLSLKYFPGGRQDRVAAEGEALTVKVYADIINEMGFNSVNILDPHSDVTPAVLDNCYVQTNEALVLGAFVATKVKEDVVFFIPDAGAIKKTALLAAKIMQESDIHVTIVQCQKHRDVATGKLTGFGCDWDVIPENAVHFVIDDICDGGGTFLGQAKAIKEAFGPIKLNLVVSHGIFSNGFKALESEFENIFTTDSWEDYDLAWKMNYNAHKGSIPNVTCIRDDI